MSRCRFAEPRVKPAWRPLSSLLAWLTTPRFGLGFGRAKSLILLVALGVVACQGKIGGDSAQQSQSSSSGAGGMVSVNSPCPLGQTSCDGRCVDTATDAAHCGSCTLVCGAVVTKLQKWELVRRFVPQGEHPVWEQLRVDAE